MIDKLLNSVPTLPSLRVMRTSLAVASTTSRVVRCTMFIADKIFGMPHQISYIVRGTYFFSAIRLPVSVYYLGESCLKIRHSIDLYQGILASSSEILGKIGILSNDIFHLLKGFRAFRLMDKRCSWLVEATPFACAFGAISFIGRLYGDLNEIKKRVDNLKDYDQGNTIDLEKREHLEMILTFYKLAAWATFFDMAGVGILTFSQAVTTGYAFLGISAVVSLSRYAYNVEKEI